MKKRLLIPLLVLFALCCAALFSSCELILPDEQDPSSLFHVHAFTTYKADEEGHWLVCRCGEPSDWEEHDFQYEELTPASCEVEGTARGECAVCGYETQKNIPKRGHVFGEWTVTTPATETEEGLKSRTCAVCHETQTRVIPVIGTLIELDPEDYYAYQYLVSLGEDGREMLYVYTQLVEGAQRMEEKIDLTAGGFSISKEQLDIAYDCYRCDYPQHFWVDDGYNLTHLAGEVRSISPRYCVEPEDLAGMQAEVEKKKSEFLQGISPLMDEIEIEILIHDRLVLANTYDTTYNAEHTHSLYGSMVNGSSVCDGYAEAFQYLLYCAGIQALSITGDGDGEYHAWNAVRLNGNYYLVDITWNDPVLEEPDPDFISYIYLNLTDEQMSVDHTPSDTLAYPLPVCNTTGAGYYHYYGYVMDRFIIENIGAVLAAQKANGIKGVYSFYVEQGGMTTAGIGDFLDNRANNRAFYRMIEEVLGLSDPAVSFHADASGYVVTFTITPKAERPFFF